MKPLTLEQAVEEVCKLGDVVGALKFIGVLDNNGKFTDLQSLALYKNLCNIVGLK